jgi:hypothetical protein
VTVNLIVEGLAPGSVGWILKVLYFQDLLKNLFPQNLVQSTMSHVQTNFEDSNSSQLDNYNLFNSTESVYIAV